MGSGSLSLPVSLSLVASASRPEYSITCDWTNRDLGAPSWIPGYRDAGSSASYHLGEP